MTIPATERMGGAQDVAELISLALTWPTIIGAGLVLMLFGQRALISLKEKQKSASDWFSIGIATGFLGGVLDNLYWSVPWTALYLGLSFDGYLVEIGVFFNIFFRQAAGIVAAYCHSRSAIEFCRIEKAEPMVGLNRLHNIYFLSAVVGIIYSVILCWIH